MSLLKKFSPFYNLAILYLAISFVLRIVLIFHPITQSTFVATDILKIFTFGLVSDFFILLLQVVFVALSYFYIKLKVFKTIRLHHFWFYVSLARICYFFNTILNEYGGVLPEIGMSFIAIKQYYLGYYYFYLSIEIKLEFGFLVLLFSYL